MILEKIQVQNFRSIENETLNCSSLTALVGRNGSGKSSFLRALDLFYNQNAKVDNEDFYNRDIQREIVVSVTFKELSDDATSLFSRYLQDGTLTVQKVFTVQEGKMSSSYHGSALQNADFNIIRQAENATKAKSAYNTLKASMQYSELPHWTSKDAILQSLQEWENRNPGSCTMGRDDGQFFGFKSVATGYLGRFTKFLFIPAIRDAAADAVDGQPSPIKDLMDLVVRSILASKPELNDLKSSTQVQFANLMAPSNLPELGALASSMTETLQNFVPEASIEMDWQKLGDVDFPLPKADTKLNQDGYSSPVNRAGHGLQRAFIITALQHLALAQQRNSSENLEAFLPTLVLAIEEPELYQHPNSQHHLAKILAAMAEGRIPGVAEKTQVIYGTHSPDFVGINRINQIRLLRKEKGTEGYPKITKVTETTLQFIADELHRATGSTGTKFTEATLITRLHTIMTRTMNEGFFADVAVLVEGEDDIAALKGYAEALGHDLESMGISVIGCGGKNSIDRPALIFKNFGIPIFIIWDSDTGQKDPKPEHNHTLLRILGEETADFPETQVKEQHACFGVNLESTLKDEIGSADFERLLAIAQNEFDIPLKKDAIKNPVVINHIIRAARSEGKSSKTIENIIGKIIILKTGRGTVTSLNS